MARERERAESAGTKPSQTGEKRRRAPRKKLSVEVGEPWTDEDVRIHQTLDVQRIKTKLITGLAAMFAIAFGVLLAYAMHAKDQQLLDQLFGVVQAGLLGSGAWAGLRRMK